MIITMLTKIDWAGSGRKMYEAIKQHTDHDIEFYSDQGRNLYNIPRGGLSIGNHNRAQVQKRIDESDGIHLKSDWPAYHLESHFGLRIRHRPVIQTISAGLFRKHDPVTGLGKGMFKPTEYKDCVLRTSFEPDLLYPEYDGILTPYPIDSLGKDNIWKFSSPPVFVHHPTTERSKDTPFLLRVLNKLSMDETFIQSITKGKKRIPQAESIKNRMGATIFFDQFGVGAYGNAAVEAMQYGIPVCVWIPQSSWDQAKGALDGCPTLGLREKNEDEWVEMIRHYIHNPDELKEISKATKKWCDEKHSYQAVAEQWDNLYKQVLL